MSSKKKRRFQMQAKIAAAVGFLLFMPVTLYALPLLSVDMEMLRIALLEVWARWWNRQRVA